MSILSGIFSKLSPTLFAPSTSIVKGDGNDLIAGLPWHDYIDAGNGNNTVIQLLAGSTIKAGSGNDIIKTGFFSSKIDAGDGKNTVIALGGHNQIESGSGSDYIATGFGDDVIDAGDGNNYVHAGAGRNTISTGSGNDTIHTLWGNDFIESGAGNDCILSDGGKDRIFAGAGDDYVDAGSDDDFVQGGRGNDTILGGAGHDVLYGDGFEGKPVSVDFLNAASWTDKLTSDGTEIRLDGATLSAGGGVFAPNKGLGILSPSDTTSGFGFPKEIDAWNDTPESVSVSFDAAQTKVGFTLGVFFTEKLIIVEPELADLTVHLQGGSTKTILLKGTPSGTLDVELNSSDFGGQAITGFDLAPNPKLWDILKPTRPADYNANHPFSEFTLTKLAFEKDASAEGPNNDVLCGGSGNDLLDGGWGNDKLFGESGCDTLNGGQGDNYLHGGSGQDIFVFDQRATGNNKIADFSICDDKLSFQDGVSVVSSEQSGGDLVLKLDTGGIVTLSCMAGQDWTHLV